jgi:integrase
VPGTAPQLLVLGDSPLLRPDEQVFEAMLAGWWDQQRSRNLRVDTIKARMDLVLRFQRFTSDWPWVWRPQDLEEFTSELRVTGAARGTALSTVRGYHSHIRLFCDYVSDPRYQWTAVCERLFDYADDQVAAARTSGRKGWLAAMRDAVAFKVAYAWGLRRREVAMLELADFGSNPHAPEFGAYGVLYVPLSYRVAGCFILIFGQPVNRITALRLDQVNDDGDTIALHLGTDPVAVPEPLATLLRAYLERRPNTNTAANAHSPWLFPGTTPGRHLSNHTMTVALRAAGLPPLPARTGTWLTLVRQAPPSVLADALGITAATAMNYANRAGVNFLSYATRARPRL